MWNFLIFGMIQESSRILRRFFRPTSLPSIGNKVSCQQGTWSRSWSSRSHAHVAVNTSPPCMRRRSGRRRVEIYLQKSWAVLKHNIGRHS